MRFIGFVAIGFFFLILPIVVSGQAVEEWQPFSVVQAQITENPVPTDILSAHQNKYFRLLDQYRQQEQNYFIAKSQFIQLNTLASQELAVKETKALIDIRADILITYLDMLTELLQRTTGVPLEYKNPQLVQLGLLKDKLLLHKNANLSHQDRLQIDQEAQEFTELYQQLQIEAYYTLGIIRIGRVQTAIDKLRVVRDAVFADVESRELSVTAQAEKTRGFQEIDRSLQDLESSFNPIRTATLNQEREGSLKSDTELSKSLEPTFTLINQTVRFLQEIRR